MFGPREAGVLVRRRLSQAPTSIGVRQRPARGEERIRETGRMLERIVGNVSGEKLYRALGNGGPADPAFSLPFWTGSTGCSSRGSGMSLTRIPSPGREAVSTAPPPAPPETATTTLRNLGNYHHFVNVVAALARLVHYFRTPATCTRFSRIGARIRGSRLRKAADPADLQAHAGRFIITISARAWSIPATR